MDFMLDNSLLRRSLTTTGVVVGLVLVTGLLPVLLPTALLIDLTRKLTTGTPFMAVRILLFGWVYLIGEAWGLAILAVTAVIPEQKSIAATYRLQAAWAGWNFRAVRAIFGLSFVVGGDDEIRPGPIVLLSRHASLIDTLLPSWFVTRGQQLRIRYILKKELLLDPALDIAGNRLPNHFVDRGAGDSEPDRDAIRHLASSLEEDEAILIYPEGTRYSDEKRSRYVRRFSSRRGRVATVASTLKRVLPPRPGGTLAILESCQADVVVLMHRGLEGFARVKDMWKGGIVGSEINVLFRRIARGEVPQDRTERITWLFELWRDIDLWVSGEEAVAEPT